MPQLGFEYELTRSKRRTLSVKISRDAVVKVYAPQRMSQKQIDEFLFDNRAWVSKHLEEARKQKLEADAFVPGRDRGLLLLGREYPLMYSGGGRAGFDGQSFFVPQGTGADGVSAALKEVYRSLAKDYLPRRTYELAARFGETVASVKINSARTRWGSCSSKGNINLSLFLMMAPTDAVDYCIIHELAHLKHMDHSPEFWRLVGIRCPDYKQKRAELKKLNDRLLGEKW